MVKRTSSFKKKATNVKPRPVLGGDLGPLPKPGFWARNILHLTHNIYTNRNIDLF